MAKYNKPPQSIDQLIQILKDRGLHVPSDEEARHYLSNISYYRLSAYMVPHQIKNGDEHIFKENVAFKDILNLYTFDRELRLLILDAIERIEIAARTQIIHQLSIEHSAQWFENSRLFRNQHFHSKHIESLDTEIDRSTEEFIQHHKRKYSTRQRPPAWKSLEVSSFGLLSKFYENLKKNSAKKRVSAHFGMSPTVFENWIFVLSNLRNTCAHHSRVWNQVFSSTLLLPNSLNNTWLKKNDNVNPQKVYAFLCSIIYLLKIINPPTSFIKLLKALLKKYPMIDINAMGFPKNWMTEDLWK